MIKITDSSDYKLKYLFETVSFLQIIRCRLMCPIQSDYKFYHHSAFLFSV